MANHFFLIFITTIAITRLWLWETRLSCPTIKGFRLHHYMYGLGLIVLALVFNNLFMYAVGVGLFVDEIFLFVMFRGWKWPDPCHEYNSWKSALGILILIAIVFLARNFLVAIF
ncbi:MAG: hypothetical protein AAB638_02825 [Patescibacteria group bacterium]